MLRWKSLTKSALKEHAESRLYKSDRVWKPGDFDINLCHPHNAVGYMGENWCDDCKIWL